MPDEAIQAKIEALAERLVLCEANDLTDLADLHTGFQELSSWAESEGLPRCRQASSHAGDTIESVILQEAEDPGKALDEVGRILAVLQSIVRDGRKEDEVDFPAGRGAADGESVAPPVDAGFVLPAHVDASIFSDFLARQSGELDEMESRVLSLEEADSASALADLKRQLHTLKGESALLGLTEVEHLCHTVEGAIAEYPPAQLIDGLLAMKDWLKQQFEAYAGKGESPGNAGSVIERFMPAPVSEAPPAAFVPGFEAKKLEGDPELLGDFIAEATEHLENSDLHLLTLETNPHDKDAIDAVFRAFHTIKGVTGFLALDEMKTLAHEAESLLDQTRKGEVTLSGAAIDVVFESVDMLKAMVERVREALTGDTELAPDDGMPALVGRIRGVLSGKGAPHAERARESSIVSNQPLGAILVEERKVRAEAVERALDSQAQVAERKKIGEILQRECVVSKKQVNEALELQQSTGDRSPLGETLIKMGAATREAVEAALCKQSEPGARERLGELLVKSGEVKAADIARALRTQRERDPEKDQRAVAVQVRESVKVDAVRLDQLVDMVGELVIAESMVAQSRELTAQASPELQRHLGQLDKITRELQEMSMSLRMVPVRATFQKMARLVRDLAKKTNKPVAFHMQGEDTELDKTVVDKIGDPLVHMVRNAVDHGLEASADERAEAGKAPTGNVYLRAFHKGGSIHIEIQDDGKGLNRDAILKKAIERGLIRDSDALSDREIYGLIFEPGFSTAQKLTEVSGRGVGMDVVKRNIDALRGQTDIQSVPGKGSTFTIRLPLTLAIIDGMVVRVGTQRYIVPTLSIIISVRPDHKDLTTVANRGRMLSLQGRLLPLFDLSRVFDIEGDSADPTEGTVIVLENEGARVAILIDEILGQQQIVIKPLGEALHGLPGIAGGAIMPDGNVGLIVDVAGLVKLATNDNVPQPAAAGAWHD